VDDEEKGDAVVIVRSSLGQMVEAAAEPGRELEPLEEFLEDDDSGEGSELLILEPELRYATR